MKIFPFKILTSLGLTALVFISAELPAQSKAFPDDTLKSKKEITIAFLLPFNADKVFITDLDESGFYFPDETQVSAELYQGALLALDSLKKMGLKATVVVYDVGNDSATIQRVLAKRGLANADLIVGPLSGYALKTAADYAKAIHTPLISPLSAIFVAAENNPFLILANATMKTHCEAIYDYLLQENLTHRLIMVYRNRPHDLALVGYLKEYGEKKKSEGSLYLKFIELNDTTKTTYLKLRDSLFITDKNIVLIPSNDENFVRLMIRKMSALISDYRIEVFGMPTWNNFGLIPAEQFDTTNTIITTSYWLDKELAQAQRFKTAYSEKFNADPTDYSVRGYDEMMYFGTQWIEAEKKAIDKESFPSLLMTTADFRQMATRYRIIPVSKNTDTVCYFENQSIFFLQHQKRKWVKIK